MDLGLNRLPWKGQIAAFVGLALVGVGVFWYFYASPAQESLAAREAQLATIQAEIQRGLVASARLPEFRQEIVVLEAQLEELRAVLPEEQDVADLLRRVQAMATQSRLTIRGFTPQSVANRDLYAEWPIGLQLEGTYHDLGDFLERISLFPRIINVTTFQIDSLPASTDSATITVDCTATTFVLIEPEPPAPVGSAAD